MPNIATAGLAPAEFHEIAGIVYDVARILLPPGKEGLVQSRLAKRLRARRVVTYAEYLGVVRDRQSGELAEMIDVLTTNKTSFYREEAHFEFLAAQVLPRLGSGPLRIWSAGCSTGEEPYTLAMVLTNALPDLARRDVRILATDISRRVLAQAQAATYADDAVDDVPPALRRHFARGAHGWEVAPAVRALVTFAPLNLISAWPMRGPFQAIFCRNVMIYFDRPTQEALVRRFHDLLVPGGHFFCGHSESLTTPRSDFTYLRPAVYQRPPAGTLPR